MKYKTGHRSLSEFKSRVRKCGCRCFGNEVLVHLPERYISKISYVVLRLLLFYSKVHAMFARGWGEGKVSRAITPTELMSEYKKKKLRKAHALSLLFC